MFPKVNSKQSFPALEEEVLKFWKENDTFKKSVENRPAEKPYRFYDGPPFITGTPHYGSLLSSIIKDIVPRYHTMQGKRVERVWGWDCHGLPIEEKVQKKLGLAGSKDIEEKVGIKTFIEECYKYTKETSAEWDWYIDHIGRWVDMENAYRTMGQDYMESVIWVFSELWKKGMIYKGQRVSLYSWKLSTPISNFEVAMDDSYQEVSDPAITVMFPIKRKKSVGIELRTPEGKALHIRRRDNGLWEMPGGKLEEGENYEEAAKRELYEETGLRIDFEEQLEMYDFANGCEWEEIMFFGKISETTPIVLEEKFSEYGFFSVEEAEKLNRSVYSRPDHRTKTFPHTENTYLLAWTTTPWTIPAHMAIAVNSALAYSRVLCEGKYFILATARVEHVFKGREFEIIETFMGSELIGLNYEAPFSYYQGKVDASKNHIVLDADFVTDSDGTGIAHEAPEFGDVDFQLAKKNGVHISAALDNEGKYTDEISDYVGLHYQEANDVISAKLKEMGRLFKKESINHRVAMCPRSGTPLIYKAQDSWFINIGDLKGKLIAENEGINWQPNHLKHGQFLKSVESAPDWCISRTRYWGTPMPIWIGTDVSGKQVDMKVFGSKAEIEAASGMQVTDFHRPYIDDITWTENGITYKRIPEVLDVWMDSGSMPYAQMHYPFEKKAEMVASYPADFIVEYIGQVRAWFYVMHVVGVALFDTRSFTNVITTGIVNGNDGRKMSKSYGNYPDPRKTIETYGADAIRFYMANSPLLTGGNMDFKEEGIVEVIKKVILPLWNTYSFFTTYANIDGFEKPHPTSPYKGEEQAAASSLLTKEGLEGGKSNPLDTWILSETHKLIDDVVNGMEKYEVTEATRPIVRFMDNLTNWYVRRSRKRFWKSENDGDKMQAYETLYEVLVTLCKVMAPFTPFVTEHIYKNLTGQESLHLANFPTANLSLVDMKLNADMDLVQKIINLGLGLRTRAKIRVRQPLLSVSIGHNLSEYYKEILKEELNVKEVLVVDANSIAQKICKPNGRLIGPKFGGAVKDIISEAKLGNFTELPDGRVQVGEYILEGEEFEIAFITLSETDNVESGFGMAISMNLEVTPQLELEGYARDLVRQIQEARKEANYNVDDRISLRVQTENIEAILASYDICSETLSTLDTTLSSGDLVKEVEIGDGKMATLILKK